MTAPPPTQLNGDWIGNGSKGAWIRTVIPQLHLYSRPNQKILYMRQRFGFNAETAFFPKPFGDYADKKATARRPRPLPAASFPPPTFRECNHGSFARRRVAMRRCASCNGHYRNANRWRGSLYFLIKVNGSSSPLKKACESYPCFASSSVHCLTILMSFILACFVHP